jgi:hypothetical protein
MHGTRGRDESRLQPGIAATRWAGILPSMTGARSASLERPSWVPAVCLSALLAITLAIWDPHVRDLAAHVYREQMFERSGFALWNASWYGGHYLLTHSVLFPPLAALFGTQVVGVASVVASTYLFDRLVHERWGARARPATLWFAVGTVTMLASGRLSFALGVAFALASLLALQRGRIAWTVAAAMACALASPVAAAFLAGVVAVGAIASRSPRRVVLLAVAAAALVPVGVINIVFADGGQEPFVFSAWIALPLWSAGALYATRGLEGERELRAVILAYLLVGTAVWLIPNPLGGNATRLGALFGGPVIAAVLLSRRVRLATPAIALLLAGSLWWQMAPAVRDVAQSLGDASTRSSYYEPLASWLNSNGAEGARIEVPFTSGHWETAYLAPDFELARGWLRQLDRTRNPIFYDGRLTHQRYREWLQQNGIRYVALPDAKPDYSARVEHALVESQPSYLSQVAVLDNWRVYRVRDTLPLLQARGDASGTLARLEPQAFVLNVSKPGRFIVRVRATPFWKLSGGAPGCVGKSGRWTVVRADRPGPLRVSIRFSLKRAGRSATGWHENCLTS